MQVFYDSANDRDHALVTIQTLLPVLPNTEFVAVALPTGINPIQANTHPRARLIQANPTGRADRPVKASYIGHWNAGSGYQNVRWYRMEWNQYISLGCGAKIYFNDILDSLT